MVILNNRDPLGYFVFSGSRTNISKVQQLSTLNGTHLEYYYWVGYFRESFGIVHGLEVSVLSLTQHSSLPPRDRDFYVFPYKLKTGTFFSKHRSTGLQIKMLCFSCSSCIFQHFYFQVVIFARTSSFLLVFLFNALMWTLCVKSLRGSSTSATATVTNTGSNFIFTVSTNIQYKYCEPL